MPNPKHRVTVESTSTAEGPSAATVKSAVSIVLRGEGVGSAEFSVTFLSSQRMRAMNRRLFGKDRATDVVALGMSHPDVVVGDIYVCPPVARRSAHDLMVTEREELLRLVVHGALHALGYDHPEDDERYGSRMWSLQEDYLQKLLQVRK